MLNNNTILIDLRQILANVIHSHMKLFKNTYFSHRKHTLQQIVDDERQVYGNCI